MITSTAALRERFVSSDGVALHVVEAGPADGPLVVLLHGFPEFWYGWRHQIGPLAKAGYRVLVPDQRGYNTSDKPRRVADYRIEPTAQGFLATGCQAWQPQSNALSEQGSMVDYRYELTSPYCAVLTKLPQAQDRYRDEIALFVCPMEAERSRVWFRLAVTDFDSSDADLRAFQHTIFTQDQPILESQRPRLLPPSSREVHSAADRASAAYRRLLLERGITFGVEPPQPSACTIA